MKGLKFFIFIFVIVMGTKYTIRRAAVLSQNVTIAVKNSLLVNKDYIPITSSSPNQLQKKDLDKLRLSGFNLNSKEILVLNHRCRINDSLYNIAVLINKDSSVIAVGKPVKINVSEATPLSIIPF